VTRIGVEHLPLRAPDAINIAIAQRLDTAIATFDDKMAACARALGAVVTAA
jgi:predicted nucleic acid-binding protein